MENWHWGLGLGFPCSLVMVVKVVCEKCEEVSVVVMGVDQTLLWQVVLKRMKVDQCLSQIVVIDG